MLIKVTPYNEVATYEYPQGSDEHIGNKLCEYLDCQGYEVVKPIKLYTVLGQPSDPMKDSVVMLVDSYTLGKRVNMLATYLYEDMIAGDVLFVGHNYYKADIFGLDRATADSLFCQIKSILTILNTVKNTLA